MTALDKSTAKVGVRVQNSWGELGIVRWVGEIKNGPSGLLCGVEYDEPTHGRTRTDGILLKQRYFSVATPGTGEFVKAKYLMTECWPELAKKLAPMFPTVSEVQLMKFILARKCNEKHVVEMLKKHLTWVATAKPNADERIPKAIGEVYPLGLQGVDLEGNLLVVERPGCGGKMSPKEIMKRYGVEMLTRWHITVMENLKRNLVEKNVKRATFLIDLSSLGEVSSKVLQWARAISAIDQDNYPETVKRIIIINAPGFFASVWSAVKLFIDERTREKVMLFGHSGYKDVIRQFIEEKYLPPFAGGTCENFMSRGGCVGTPSDAQDALRECPSVDDDEVFASVDNTDSPVFPIQQQDSVWIEPEGTN